MPIPMISGMAMKFIMLNFMPTSDIRPTIQITPGDANAPIVIPVPNDVPIGPALPPATTEDTNALSDAAAPLDVPDTNQPPGN